MRRASKWLVRSLAILAGLILLLGILIQLPVVQTEVAGWLVKKLSNSLNTKIEIERVRIHFFTSVELHGVYIEDQSADTLLVSDRIYLDLSAFSLWRKKLHLKQTTMEGLKFSLEQSDTSSNIDFLLDAFKSNGSAKEPWEISLREINVMDLTFGMYQSHRDANTNVTLGSLHTDLGRSDLSQRRIYIDGLDLDQLKVDITPQSQSMATDDVKGIPGTFALPYMNWEILLNDLLVTKSQVIISNPSAAKVSGFDPRNLMLEEMAIYINRAQWTGDNLTAELESASFSDPRGFYLQQLAAKIQIDSNRIDLDNLIALTPQSKIENSSSLQFITIRDQSEVRYQLDFGSTNIVRRDLDYFSVYLQKVLPFVNVKEIDNIHLAGRVFGDRSSVILNSVQLRAGDLLEARLDARISNLGGTPEEIELDVRGMNVSTTQDGFTRLTGISWSPSLRHLGQIRLEGKARGGLQEMIFDRLNLETGSATGLSLSGVVRHLNDGERLEGDLEIHALTAHADDLTGIISDTLKGTLSNFGLVTYSGFLKGDLKNLFLKGHADTEIGCLESDLNIVFSDDHQTGFYSGVLAMEQFRLGQMIGDPEVDWITFTANGDGSGFSLNDLKGEVNLEIDSFRYRQYVYHDLIFRGQIESRKLDGLISSKDQYLSFDFDGLLDLTDSIPQYSFEMQIDNADLNSTNLVEQDLQISGFVKADGRGSNIDDILGNISFQNVYLKSDSLTYQGDNLTLSSSHKQGSRSLSLTGDDFQVLLDGRFKISSLALSVRDALSRYYTSVGIDSLKKARITGVPQDFEFDLRFFDPMLFKIFLPDLNSFDNMVIEGQFLTERPEIDFIAFITNISYQDLYSDSLVVRMSGRNEDLQVGLSAKALQIGKVAEYPSVNFNGHIKNDTIDWDIAATADSIGRKIWVDGTLTQDGDTLQLTLQDSLRAGGYLWSVDEANQILYRPGYILVDHLNLQYQEQKISVQSNGSKAKPDPLTVKFDEFELRALSDLAGLGDGNFSGRISGSFDLFELFQDPWYRADLQVDNLTMLDTVLGDLTFKAQRSPANNQVQMNATLTGGTNQAMANAIYFPKQKSIQGEISLDRAEMRLLDPFVEGILRNNTGSIAGNLQVEGSLDAIHVVGQIDLKDASTVVEINSSRYRIPDHSILVDDNTIDLASMRIIDDNGYEATLRGKIHHSFMRDFVLDLELTSDQFQFLNTTVTDNPTFHGKLVLDALVSAKGPVRQPEVQVRARTLEGSNFTLSTFVESKEVKGPDYILFGNPLNYDEDSLSLQSYQVTNRFPFRATVTLEATEEAQFFFVVDPESGDHLSCRGTANLILEFQPSGHISIYGQYNVTSGTYFFSYGDLIKRNFSLLPGSTVSFSGDPLNASFNLNAKYSTQTAVYDLIRNEASLAEDEIRAAQRREVVDVLMEISGPLSSPKISFDIQLPEQEGGLIGSAVNRKLASIRGDPDELNQQVFSLLLFRSFMTTNRSGSIANSLSGEVVLSSLSRLFSDQLNRLAEKYVKGVEVSIDIETYKSEFLNEGAGGTATEVDVGVSKRLFNDRISISAASTFDVNSSQEQTGFSAIAGDFLLEYRLTESGNYILKVFRRSDYDVIDETNTAVNGISISYQKSFNRKKKKIKEDE